MHSEKAAATPLARNEATFSFCHTSRSVRIRTAILVSNCMSDFFHCHSGMVHRTRPGISRFRVRCFASPRNDTYQNLAFGVAGPGANHAFLAAEFVAFTGCRI